MDQKSQFEFTLAQPVKVQKGGEHVEAVLLTLKAPSAAHRRFTNKLKQGFFQALEYHKKSADDRVTSSAEPSASAKDEITPDEFMSMMYMSGVKMEDYFSAFKGLICAPGIATIDPGVKVTEAIFDQILDDDVDRLMGEYLVNFFVASMMSRLNKS